MSDEPQLPEPSFDVLMQVIAGPCFVHLGMVANPATGEMERDLVQAKWCIDLLHVFEQKTRPNLDNDEKGRLDQMLHQLRTAYVQFSGS